MRLNKSGFMSIMILVITRNVSYFCIMPESSAVDYCD